MAAGIRLGQSKESTHYGPASGFAGYALGTIIPPAAVAAVNVPLDVRAKQAAAVRQHFAGYGTLPRLAAATNQMMFIGCGSDRDLSLS